MSPLALAAILAPTTLGVVLVEAAGASIPAPVLGCIAGAVLGLITWSLHRNIKQIDDRQDDCEERDQKQDEKLEAQDEKIEAQDRRLGQLADLIHHQDDLIRQLNQRVTDHDELLYAPVIPQHAAKSG